MKQNKNSFSILLACLSAIAAMSGCDWENEEYDTWVTSNGYAFYCSNACYTKYNLDEKNTNETNKADCENKNGKFWPPTQMCFFDDESACHQAKGIQGNITNNDMNPYAIRTGIMLSDYIYMYGVTKDAVRHEDIFCGAYNEIINDNKNSEQNCREYYTNNNLEKELGFTYEQAYELFRASQSTGLCPNNTYSCTKLSVAIKSDTSGKDYLGFCSICQSPNDVVCSINNEPVCVNVNVNPEHCGECGKDCTKSNQICVSGQCKSPTCPLGMHYGKDTNNKDICVLDSDVACGANGNCKSDGVDKAYCTYKLWVDINKKDKHSCTESQANEVLNCISKNYDPTSNIDLSNQDLFRNCFNAHCTGIDYTDGEAVCVVSSCKKGYLLVDGKCEPNTSCTDPNTHYYNGECITNDEDNCGKHNNRCADITGWNDGACTAGKCVPETCVVGYHLNAEKTACVADDTDNCGKVGLKCGEGQVCTAGDCKDNCGSGEVRCEKDGVVSCADPKTNTMYCGADDECGSYTTCDTDQACINGQCKQTSCSDQTTLCSINGENKCINLEENDEDNCGACNLKCSEQTVLNATSHECKNGKCQYTCNIDYENCGSAEVPNCIAEANLQTDPNNCGKCGEKCKADEYCSAGSCKKSTCNNQCLTEGACDNSNDKCGTQCLNCNTLNNAAEGKCNDGVCSIIKCADGYHLSVDKSECIQNTPTACAPTTESNTTDCTKSQNATDGVCNSDGTCYYTICEPGFHINNGKCAPDTDEICGAAKIDCTKLTGWDKGTCDKGVCKASSCLPNFCLSGSTCVDGSYNSISCGTTGGTAVCNNCGTGMSCVNGSCVQSSCPSGICFYEGLTCENKSSHCGKSCIDCNSVNNASSGECLDGKCRITACADGYHMKTNDGITSCEANTATLCGKSDSTDVVDCTSTNNANAGYCNIDGNCVYTSCEIGYHLGDGDDTGKCVEDSPEVCGASKVDCTNLAGWNDAECDQGVCKASTCDANYCLSGTTCVDGSSNSLACGIDGGDCKPCNSDQYCHNGRCEQIPCPANQHLDNITNECVPDTLNACGPSALDCTSISGWSSGECIEGKCFGTSVQVCGSSQTNCTSISGWSSGECIEGKCFGTSVQVCGSSQTNCSTLPGWAEGECVEGICMADSCTGDYHLYRVTCEANSETHCGKHNNPCNSSVSDNIVDTTCIDTEGICKVKECAVGYHISSDGTECIANSLDACGKTTENITSNCNDLITDNVSSVTCDGGVCKVETCATDYHIDPTNPKVCKENSNSACAAQDSNDEKTCTNPNNTCSGGKCCYSKTSQTSNSNIECCSGNFKCKKGSNYKCATDCGTWEQLL